MNFSALERDLEKAVAADEKYERENRAKFRAVEQKVATYEEFRDIVKTSHLKSLEKKETISDPSIAKKNVIWNVVANKNEDNFFCYPDRKQKKHFTEM